MMCQLVDEMARYLQDLFPLLDLSEDLNTVNKACLLIQNTFDEIAGAHSRSDSPSSLLARSLNLRLISPPPSPLLPSLYLRCSQS